MDRGQAIASGTFALVLLVGLMLAVSWPSQFEYIATAAITVLILGYLLYALVRPEEF
jgi:K+-transporting ATPase KdpF subunit